MIVLHVEISITVEQAINPQRMREGYSSHPVCVCVCVCLSVCLSVTELAATYLVYALKIGCHQAYYVDFIQNAVFKSSGEIC